MTKIINITDKTLDNTLDQHNCASIISYSLSFERFTEHLVDITLTFTAHNNAPRLWLPAWIPGSYLLREFARYITAVHYIIIGDETAINNRYRAQKVDKHTWELPIVKAGQRLSVEYEVYCFDLSVRTAYIDQQRLYGNFTSLALAVDGQEQLPVQVSLVVPAAFFAINGAASDKSIKSDEHKVILACGLTASHLQIDSQQSQNDQSYNKHDYGLQANSYHQLIDHPFEIALQQSFDFIIQDQSNRTLPHHFYLSGKHRANMGRLQQDITQICQTYLNWLGAAPFKDYTFMTYASTQDYGGLEHINSTSLIIPRLDLPSADEPELPSTDYQRFLGLCSHEYFHAWWVKTVSPNVMMDVDLRREVFTPLLWVFEGFTSYIDDFMLQAAGVIDKSSYLTLLSEQINRYYQTPGRSQQSVAESSFDAWIKLYRNDENTGNAGISYYNKGALVALCLDLTLLNKSAGRYRLFDVVKDFYSQAQQNGNQRIGISSANLGQVISQFMPKEDWDDFEQRYINGVEELPLKGFLDVNGVTISADNRNNALPWGITVQETPEGLKVSKVLRDSVASAAGLSAKDIIVAIDDIKASKKQLQAIAKSDMSAVSCHAFRRDELITFSVANKTSSGVSANPSLNKVSLRLKKSGFEQWLMPDFVKT